MGGTGHRRRALAGALGLALLTLCPAATARPGTGHADFPLVAGTVALGTGDRLVEVPDTSSAVVPGTRVLTGTPDTARQQREQLRWLAAGRVPAVPGQGGSTLVRNALLDLYVLGAESGVAVAGSAPPWRYVWPRDSALVAVALARTGHFADAERVLAFLQRVQPASGEFAARYRLDGSPVSDRRGPQGDSVGWALWALAQVTAELPADRRADFVLRYRGLLDRSARAALVMTGGRGALPPPSSDYWEKRERHVTLATATLVHAGLLAATSLSVLVGDEAQAAVTRAAATRTAAAITGTFAAGGYPRTAGGPPGSVDLGVSYLLPPFTETVDPSVLAVWRGSAGTMRRAAGGLAPGGSWRQDGVSWTTATSSYAMTAAFVEPDVAVGWLRWLDDHRTRQGSLPEKVLADGRPASVAPLAWAAAAVVIAADQLSRAGS